ncbi:carboxylesterase/lipase family protein [Actinomadura macrotermitis]|uniref:Carboxylic ester hydrolase n=1 Tax=Actinomadura macrotermitis TaxID=2585200 RepID=A0A7K0BYF2_9ACTN|nr:carboxylesterase family protein [Actinomadura macrotermitis]MQY05664.1 Para-nitrobenzyl esterase [Actinomadura macrotermitis]
MRRPLLVALSLMSAVAPFAVAGPAGADTAPDGTSVLVRTDKGTVRGEAGAGRRLFQGIPFAAAPVGNLRWRPPQPAPAWPDVRDATFPRSACAQLPGVGSPTSSLDEDCLYLNVTTPARRDLRKAPVMVWLHGGSNTSGSGAVYNASKLAVNGGAVVVTVNYRLGALGWLGHPGLESGPDRDLQAGNYGLLDQQAALRWVRRNIQAFGGDADNVTLFGESAGANDACASIASPTAAGLFHKAIVQSYSCAAPTRTTAKAEADAQAFAAAVGCADEATAVECLRALPVKTLLDVAKARGLQWGPVSGGDKVLPLTPATAIARGRFNRVPVLHGSTLDEMRLYVSLLNPLPITAERYEGLVRSTYGDKADQVLARYPVGNYPEPRIALAAVATDHGNVISTCEHVKAFDLFRDAGVPVYAYQFADRTAPPLVNVPGFDEGAEHATELSFLFPNMLGALNDEQQRLSDAMVGYWTSFARRGRPAAQDAPAWAAYRSNGDVLSLGIGAGGIHTTDTAQQSNCAFWKGLGPVPPVALS